MGDMKKSGQCGELSLDSYTFIVLVSVEVDLFFLKQIIAGDESGKHWRKMLLMWFLGLAWKADYLKVLDFQPELGCSYDI